MFHYNTVLNPEPSLDEYWTQKHSLETNYTPSNLIKKKKYQLVASSLGKEEKVKTFSSKLIENFKRIYKLGTFVSIDEMLFPFKMKCKQLQFMKNKPSRYGLKYFGLASSEGYITDFFMYEGKDTQTKSLDIVEHFASKLKNPQKKILVADNYFTNFDTIKRIDDKGYNFIFILGKHRSKELFQNLQERTEKGVWTTTSIDNIEFTLFHDTKEIMIASNCIK